MVLLIEFLIALITICAIMLYSGVIAWTKSTIKIIDIKDYNKASED